LASNLIELNQHSLDRHVPAVPFSGEHHSAIATGTELLVSVDFQAAHPEDWARHFFDVIRHRQDIWLKLWFFAKCLGLLDNFVNTSGH
jgi:hypothetical protein